MTPQSCLVPAKTLEFFDRRCQRRAVRSIEKESGDAFVNHLRGAAGPKCDDWTAGSIRLERSDAEIFFAGEQESPTPAGVVVQQSIRQAAEKLSTRPGEFFQTRAIGTLSDDQQTAVKAIAGFDCQLNPLVRHQARQNEIVVIDLL